MLHGDLKGILTSPYLRREAEEKIPLLPCPRAPLHYGAGTFCGTISLARVNLPPFTSIIVTPLRGT